MDPEKLKGLGNEALKNKQFEEAINFYTEAIGAAEKLSLPVHTYYSNRAAAQLNLENYDGALNDSDSAIAAKPDWPKGYSRRGNALHNLRRYAEAEAAYKDGLKYGETDSGCIKGLAELEPFLSGPGNSQPMGSPFGNPAEIMKKLAAHPETKEWLKDPAYMQMLMTLQQNPQNIMQYMSDPRMMKTFSVMTGLDLGAMAGGPPNAGGNSEEMETEPMPTFDHSDQPKQAGNSTTHNLNDMMEDDISDDDMETQDPAVEEAKAQKEREAMAENEKASGTAAYKKRDFELAHKHYAKSFEIDPKNMVYLLNTAAVYLEEKKFEECRKTCEKAVDVGRENRSDFKMIAKALARIGTSYEKEQNMEASMIWFNKSLAEFRDKTIMDKVKKMKKKSEEAKRRAYFSEEKFLESKGLGNECFKNADFPGGVANYNDALKRKDDQDKANHPDLAVIYCNRAACYTKLMEFSLAVTDCDKAIKFNPDFIKGYLRKGTALEAMRKPTEAKKAFELALAKDSTSTEAQNGLQRVYQKSFEERNDPEKVRERVAKDPEVREIMSDPSMRLILEQMQQNPNALKDHLQNPDISAKIQKLIDVGIISLGQR